MSIWSVLENRSSGDVLKKEDSFFTPEGLDASELEKMLKKGVVHFIYKKKPRKGQPADSGETREAWGTKHMDIVEKIPHGGSCPPKDAGYTIYFDLEKGDWRAFLNSRLVGTWKKVYTPEEFNMVYKDLKK